VGCYERGNEPTGSVKDGKFLGHWSYCYVVVIFSFVKICVS
jgi:hypothetical protein